MGLYGGMVAPSDYVNLAETDRQMLRHVAGEAPGVNLDGDFKVTIGTGMTLSVASGRAFIEGKNTFAQGFYMAWADSAATVVIPPVGATPRIDRVVLAMRDEQYGALPAGTSNGPALVVVPGAPASTPSPQTDAAVTTYVGPGGWLDLAQIAVPASATSIVAGNITDRRVLTYGRTTQERVPAWKGVISGGANFTVPHNFYRVPNWVDSFIVGGMKRVGRTIQVPKTGLYRIAASGGFSTHATGYRQVRTIRNPTNNDEVSTGAVPGTALLHHYNMGGATWGAVLCFTQQTVALNAGDRVTMCMYQNSGTTLTGYGASYYTSFEVTWVGLSS